MMWPGVLFYALEGLPSLKSWQMCQKYFWKLTFKFKRSKFWKEEKTFEKMEVVWWQQNMSFNCTWASTTKQSGRMFYFFIRGKTFQLLSFHYLKQAVIIFSNLFPIQYQVHKNHHLLDDTRASGNGCYCWCSLLINARLPPCSLARK